MIYTNKTEREIAGYFKGEGYLGIQSYTKKYKPKYESSSKRSSILYRPQMTLVARLDDIEALEYVKRKLGGYLIKIFKPSNKNSKPYALWGTNSTKVIGKICDILINSEMPSKKIEQAKVMKEYLKFRLPNGTKITYSGRRYSAKEIAKMEELKQKLHKLKRYTP